MKNMRVSRKLLVAFSIVTAMAMLVGGIGMFGMSQLKQAGVRYNEYIYALDALANFRENFQETRNTMNKIAGHADDTAYVDEQERILQELTAVMEECIAMYDSAITDPSREGNYLSAKKLFTDSYLPRQAEIVNIARTTMDSTAVDAAIEGSAELFAQMKEGFAAVTVDNMEWAKETDASNETLFHTLTVLMLVILAVVIAVSVLLGLYISGMISKPMRFMREALVQAGETGNLSFTDEQVARLAKAQESQDEIGQSILAFGKMMDQFVYYGDCMRTVADCDLSIDVNVLGEDDTCGSALRDMVKNLNRIFSEISASATQVDSGAQQISQVSQNLATGSSEQAATLEQLSATTSETHHMSEENASIAKHALDEVDEAGRLMAMCTDEMGEMLGAMREIDSKSKNISMVIKVIEDIAFQTNILALNAAVEAARAGQHGKGFAVVADEVRNLASKSADAAKETSGLIQGNMQSVEKGNSIVDKVNESIEQVTEIAGNSAKSIGKLHTSSIQQSSAMTEVSTAITELSGVVQANSATSQETAASAQEMSAQSATLEEIVKRFKLNDGRGSRLTQINSIEPEYGTSRQLASSRV